MTLHEILEGIAYDLDKFDELTYDREASREFAYKLLLFAMRATDKHAVVRDEGYDDLLSYLSQELFQ